MRANIVVESELGTRDENLEGVGLVVVGSVDCPTVRSGLVPQPPNRRVPNDMFGFGAMLEGGERPSPEEQPTDSQAVGAEQPVARAQRILIVDDDLSIVATLRAILELEGYVVETAANGAEGLASISQQVPALIILDMRMPIMDGWAFADELGNRGLHIPVLVVTAARDARRWAEEISASAFLAKPFEIDELLATIEGLIERQK